MSRRKYIPSKCTPSRGFVGESRGFAYVAAIACGREDASAGRHGFAVGRRRGACMEYYGLGGERGCRLWPCLSRNRPDILARHRHDGYRCARVCFDSHSFQPGVGCGFEHGREVGGYAGHHGLCFGVAHTDVVLDYERFAAAVDEAEEYEASVVDAFGSESGESA